MFRVVQICEKVQNVVCGRKSSVILIQGDVTVRQRCTFLNMVETMSQSEPIESWRRSVTLK